MKNLRLYTVFIFFFSLGACQTENEIVDIQPDEDWFQSYRTLMIEDNYTVELVRRGSLTFEELGLINSSGLEGQELIAEYGKYISQEELYILQEYNRNLNSLFQNVNFNESDLQRIEKINVRSVETYKELFVNFSMRASTDCEQQAATAAVGVLGGTIAAGAASSIVTGPLGVVGGVLGGIGGSLFTYAYNLYTCETH